MIPCSRSLYLYLSLIQRNKHVTSPYKESQHLIGPARKVVKWPKLVPVLKQLGHESMFEAITAIKFNAEN